MTREKHPVPGFVLPVTVDREDGTRLDVRWEEVPTILERISASDPAILDPKDTWRRVQEARHGILDAVLAGQHPETAALREQLRARSEQEQPTRSPWEQAELPGWPPVRDLPDGRLAGTALVVSAPDWTDRGRVGGYAAMGYRGNEGRMPRRYVGWLLLCVELPGSPSYGVYRRTKIETRRLGSTLPVAVEPNKLDDLEILWDRAPDQFEVVADRLSDATERMKRGLESGFAGDKQLFADAVLANIADPAQRVAMRRTLEQPGVSAPRVQPAAPGAPGPVVGGDPAGDLRRLSALRDSGVLSDSEYEAERARVLESL